MRLKRVISVVLVIVVIASCVSIPGAAEVSDKMQKCDFTIFAGSCDDDKFDYCTVSFDLCGVEADSVEKQTIRQGDYAEEPEIPYNDDYLFTGWYLDKECEVYYEFDESPVTEDITLYAGWYNDADETDTDGDGLEDEYEKLIETDLNLTDTDNDGISDFDEMEYDYDIDPCLYDTDNDGISDAEEDSDEDGLNNIEEINLGTDPGYEDTDGDELSDGDEVNLYGTNPKIGDTDSDGVDDYSEITYGTDPLV